MTNLKRIIDEKGVRQRWLAEQVGVTEVSMSRYVSGERIPKAPLAIRMADVLGVDVKELYGWDDKHVVGEPEQPEKRTEERTETHACDLISRQAAIDALDKHLRTTDVPVSYPGIISALTEWLNELPSAQADVPDTNVGDTISRQAAIKIASGFCHPANIAKELAKLPSAQPETHDKRTKTHSCDCISRQAAIDAHYEYCNKHPDAGFPVWSLKILENLPSAQPDMSEYSDKLWKAAYERGKAEAHDEIVRCNDCKNRGDDDCPMRFIEWVEYDDDGYIEHDDIIHDYTKDDGFCDRAERRTDGN